MSDDTSSTSAAQKPAVKLESLIRTDVVKSKLDTALLLSALKAGNCTVPNLATMNTEFVKLNIERGAKIKVNSFNLNYVNEYLFTLLIRSTLSPILETSLLTELTYAPPSASFAILLPLKLSLYNKVRDVLSHMKTEDEEKYNEFHLLEGFIFRSKTFGIATGVVKFEEGRFYALPISDCNTYLLKICAPPKYGYLLEPVYELPSSNPEGSAYSSYYTLFLFLRHHFEVFTKCLAASSTIKSAAEEKMVVAESEVVPAPRQETTYTEWVLPGRRENVYVSPNS